MVTVPDVQVIGTWGSPPRGPTDPTTCFRTVPDVPIVDIQKTVNSGGLADPIDWGFGLVGCCTK